MIMEVEQGVAELDFETTVVSVEKPVPHPQTLILDDSTLHTATETEADMTESESSSQTSNASEISLSQVQTTERIDEEPTDGDQHVPEIGDSNRPRRISIMKDSSEPLHIKESSRAWKCLGKPDMKAVRSMSESYKEERKTRDSLYGIRRSRSVVFGDVQIRNYSQTLGDNPSVSYGPPISLDWEYEEENKLTLDDYEDNRAPRRSLRQILLSYYNRKNVLTWQYGFSEEQLKSAKREAKKEKQKRELTRFLLPAMHVEAAVESAGRKLKRILGKKETSGPTEN